MIRKNKSALEPKVFEFVDSTLSHNVKIHFNDSNWFVKAACVGKFHGNEVKFDIFLVVEPRGNNMYKWSIADVSGDLFELKPSRQSDKIMLLPNENESNFMRLNSITTAEKDDYITLYSANCNPVNRLSVFNTLIYYGYLDIEYVADIEYTFLQVPGYCFTVKEFERASSNSGWLITSWEKVDDNAKHEILDHLYNGTYEVTSANANSSPMTSQLSQQEQEVKACSMVKSFVSGLNEYVSSKDVSALDSVKNLTNGRYSFRMSEEIVNNLAKYFDSKENKAYTIDELIEWLNQASCPIRVISVENVLPYYNYAIRSEYLDHFMLVSVDLSTDGDLQIKEQVLFLVSENQIAGVKLLADCF
jgi:hypothetical protein